MSKKNVVIIGAGIAGLSAAWHLRRKGIPCRVYEKETTVGGLCRSKCISGFTFDYCGHLLHFKRQETLKLVLALLGSNLRPHERHSWIYLGGRYVRYPFQANLFGLPAAVVRDCLLGYIDARLEEVRRGCRQAENFEQWITSTFGRGIARHFMLPYNRKFWTVDLGTMTCGWMDGFIPVPSLSQLLEGTLRESRRRYGYNATFWYPVKGGIQVLADAFAAGVRDITLGCAVVRIDPRRKTIELSSGDVEHYDILVSTVPLPELPRIMPDLPENIRLQVGKLRWNSVFNLNIGTADSDREKRHWTYFPDRGIPFFRAGCFHAFSRHMQPRGCSSLYVEASYSGRRTGRVDSRVPAMKKKLRELAVIRGGAVLAEDCNDIPYAYPIYDSNYEHARTSIIGYLARQGIVACGRYGSWQYSSMEDCIYEGKYIHDAIRRVVS